MSTDGKWRMYAEVVFFITNDFAESKFSKREVAGIFLYTKKSWNNISKGLIRDHTLWPLGKYQNYTNAWRP